MIRTRWIAPLLVLTSLLLPVTAVHGAAGPVGRTGHHTRPAAAGTVHGVDGLTYPSSPEVVPGLDGELFFGPEFDSACGVANHFIKAMKALATLARIIENSGRRAIFTLGYNKSTVFPDRIDPTQLPQGACDEFGLSAQAKIVRTFKDPNYLPLADDLARSPRQVYWKTDPHWSSVGGSVLAKALATRLDRRLGRIQHYTYGTETRLGMLEAAQGLDTPETLETAFPRTRVTVHTAKGSTAWSGYPDLTFDYSWNSSPAKLTWPGHTLLLGDSFMMMGLENLAPIFRHGRWLWYYHNSEKTITDAIKASNTVVIAIYQLFTPGTTITSDVYLEHLRKALR